MTLLNPTVFADACLGVFGATEFLLRRGDTAKSLDAGASDNATSLQILLAYAVIILLLVVVAPLAPWARIPLRGRWVAIALAALGLAIRCWSMIVLGRFYTRTLVIVGDQELVNRGPYRLVRHPGYLGSLLTWIGASLALAPPLIAATAGVILAATYARRIRHEEQMLFARLGPRYAVYSQRTWRLLPYVY
jgi:protein-S-isoprenylcysteine O-methyltransferase